MIPMLKSILTTLSNKVDKVSGKGLSTNDFTDSLKEKLEGISGGATAVSVEEIIVSPTEPETDRRKVWFQTKGKNLFDKSNILRGYLNENGTISNNNEEYFVSEFIKVEPNTKYFCGQTGSKRGKFYDSSKEVINTSFNFSTIENGVCFTTTDETYFIRVTVTAEHINNLQIEKGEGATQFEEYINPAIYVKKDNGDYEEFIKKEKEESRNWITLNSTYGCFYRKIGKDTEIRIYTHNNSTVKLPATSGVNLGDLPASCVPNANIEIPVFNNNLNAVCLQINENGRMVLFNWGKEITPMELGAYIKYTV